MESGRVCSNKKNLSQLGGTLRRQQVNGGPKDISSLKGLPRIKRKCIGFESLMPNFD
jgi:hypothetical protein